MRNKRKGIMMAAAILGSAAIISTGFAAWVITSDTSTPATGNIDVDSVNDDRLSLDSSWKNGNTVVFGAPAEKNATNEWLKVTGDVEENMSLTLVIDPKYADDDKNGDQTGIDGSLKVSIAIDGGKTLNSEYVKLPTFEESYTVTDGAAVEIPVNFTWGDHFKVGENYLNPYNFYNDGIKTGADYGDDALDALQAIEAYADYTFTITVTFNWA